MLLKMERLSNAAIFYLMKMEWFMGMLKHGKGMRMVLMLKSELKI